MILVDTSIWTDHLRANEPALQRLLEHGHVLGHPWVTGELALGNLSQRQEILGLLSSLPAAPVVTPEETLVFVEGHHLMGRGVGYVDVQLLAATRMAAAARLRTRDRRLAVSATQLGLAVDPALLEEP